MRNKIDKKPYSGGMQAKSTELIIIIRREAEINADTFSQNESASLINESWKYSATESLGTNSLLPKMNSRFTRRYKGKC
jgi:hypothetical protein